jgi:hypothetical protein
LFDLDASGLTIWDTSVSRGPSDPPLSTDWVHFSVVFDNTYAYAAPTFELFNANSQQGDSSVLVDNVRVRAAIPEPAPILLLATVLLAFTTTRWRRGRLNGRPLPPSG